MAPRRDGSRDEDLADLLDDLAATLSDLRRELDAREEAERRGPTARERERYGYRPPPADRGRDPERDRRGDPSAPRPPSVGELLRFTDEYTIPTVIALLETTIRSLELLRGVIRLADPGRSAFDDGRDGRTAAERIGASRLGRDALSTLDSALSDLGGTLTDADLPEDETSRSILEDARGLIAEIEARVDESERARRRTDGVSRPGRGGPSGRSSVDGGSDPVRIDVTDAEAEGDGDATGDDRPRVDVEAELESIRREVRGESDATDSADAADGSDGSPRSSGSDESARPDDADDSADAR
jgi:hypothetical protein